MQAGTVDIKADEDPPLSVILGAMFSSLKYLH